MWHLPHSIIICQDGEMNKTDKYFLHYVPFAVLTQTYYCYSIDRVNERMAGLW